MPTTAILSLSGFLAIALEPSSARWLEGRSLAPVTFYPCESHRHVESDLAYGAVHDAGEIAQPALLGQLNGRGDTRLAEPLAGVALLVNECEHEDLAPATHLHGCQFPGETSW